MLLNQFKREKLMDNKTYLVSKTLSNVKQLVRKMLYGREFKLDKETYIRKNKRKKFDYHKKFGDHFIQIDIRRQGRLGHIFGRIYGQRGIFIRISRMSIMT